MSGCEIWAGCFTDGEAQSCGEPATHEVDDDLGGARVRVCEDHYRRLYAPSAAE